MAVARRMGFAVSLALLALALTVPAAGASVKFTRLFSEPSSSSHPVAIARTPDGSLHLVFQTYSGRSLSGLGAISISAGGKPGPLVQALAGWQAGQPGLVATSGGALGAVFGAISPSNVSSVWGISSADGGATWSAPVDVRGGGPNEALAYGSDVTAAMAGATPILTLPQAGNLVIQTGLGAGSPSYPLTSSSDGSTLGANLATDSSSGAVVASWPSGASTLRDYIQAAAPSVGAVQAIPGQYRNSVEIAGRDAGSGVFVAYTTDNSHVRLLRYGGGSVGVGSRHGTTAKVLGVATSLVGRVWVMWGDDSGGGIAVTRSNKAVTRFEPIQHLDPKLSTLARVSGDGRLGPLDLLVLGMPAGKTVVPPAESYARVFPELSATVSVKPIKNKLGKVIAHTLTVKVTDAGDPVAGAKVSTNGVTKTTSSAGVANLTLPGSKSSLVKVTVTAAGYQALTKVVNL